MKVTIQKAKNGENTASVEGHFLHSNYAPVKEAQRFVDNLSLPFTPTTIIITEPALSYCADFLKQKFPEIKTGVIRYINDFSEYNSKFDFVINYYEHPDFETYLENNFTEEHLLTTHFISWPASSQLFNETDKIVWNAIRQAMIRAKTLLITRQYFEKKWLYNSCNFLKYCSKTISFVNTINKPALIISSGPSLIPFINIIKDNQDKFFIICLSSAISVCIKNGITPDLCMTTDGGYWAGEHLKALYKNDIPVAIPSEAYCPKNLLRKLTVMPLDYGDGISSALLKTQNIQTIQASRNGTVSGTALLFAYKYCTNNIYLCGLDMSAQKGFQHTQPNELEKNSSYKDNRISTKQTRLGKSELTNGSLDIYKNWFINNPLKTEERKIFRLMEKEYCRNSLGWIKDITAKDFIDLISKHSETSEINFITSDFQFDKSECLKLLYDSEKNIQWKKQLFPLDFVQAIHDPLNKEIENRIETEWQKLQKRIERIFS